MSLQVIDDKQLVNGETEFYFSNGEYNYAKQQYHVNGAPWLKLGVWSDEEKEAVIAWSGCKFV